jgi:deoxyribonuclease V
VWPTDADALTAAQRELAGRDVEAWQPLARGLRVAGCWVCFPRGMTGPGGAGDPAWTAAVVQTGRRVVDRRVLAGAAGAPYAPGLLALRVGPLLEQVVRTLREPPDVLLLDATGRDHPRGAGLALQLGAELDLPTIGVTHRPLLADGAMPDEERGATSPLRIAGKEVARWVRTRSGVRPLVVHPGWRVDLQTATELVLAATTRQRTPEPLRQARHLARRQRAGSATVPPHSQPRTAAGQPGCAGPDDPFTSWPPRGDPG